MAKIFLDIGGYAGESSLAALDPRFAFDRIYCFEPSRACCATIQRNLRSPRLSVVNAGLLDRTASIALHHAGSLGGSVYADAPDTGGDVEMCDFIEASAFFRENIRKSDQVWMKLNCEGAECDVLLNLFASGEAAKLTEVLVDFDAAKIASARDKLRQTQALLKTASFSYHFPEEVQYEMVSNYGGIRNWLIVTGAIDSKFSNLAKSLPFQAQQIFNSKVNGYYKIRLLRSLGLKPKPSVPTRPSSAVGRPTQRPSAYERQITG